MIDFYTGNSFIINLIAINAILALSIYITLSCAMLSLSNAASAAIGAYTAALLTTNLGWGLWPAVLAGALLAGLVALALGLPILRLSGVYLAIATIGFGEVVRIAIVNTDALGGSEGFRLNTGPHPVSIGFWEVYGALVVVAYFFSRLKGSRMGMALQAIREDENAARTTGIDVTFYKVSAYVIGAFVAGLAGGLYAHLIAFLTPATFNFNEAVQILLFAVVGGAFAWRGAILGAFIITILPEVLRFIPGFGGINIKDQPEIFTGAILLAIILFLPNGLLSAALRIRTPLFGRRTPPPRPATRPRYDSVDVNPRPLSEEPSLQTGAGPREEEK